MKTRNTRSLPAPADLLGPSVDIVVAAGARLRAEFHRSGGPRGAGSKAEIDAELESYLKRRLRALHPCDWHGEELPREDTGHSDVWVVDPQDGTRAFLKGLRGSSVSVALFRCGKPVLGIVFAPTAPDDAGDLFWWAEGLPPRRNGVVMSPIGPGPAFYGHEHLAEAEADWPPTAAIPGIYDAGTIIALNEEAGDYAADNHERFAPAGILAIPSIAYRLALAAAGEADAAISITHGLDPYDIGGGLALLQAVGGTITDLDGQPASYDRHAHYKGCVGGRPEIVSEIVRRHPSPGRRVKRHPARPAGRIASTRMLEKAQGTLLGQLAGDSLGSLVEFRTADDIAEAYPNGVRDLAPGGTWNLLAGQPTDDSEMALALARSICTEGGFNSDKVGQAYAAWGHSNPFDIGNTTSQGLAAISGRGRANITSQANGALMRVSPIGIANAGRPGLAAKQAAEDAALTHPNPVCIAASSAFAAAIAGGITGADRLTMWSLAHAHAGQGDGAAAVRNCLETALETGPAEFISQMGWVMIALGNAFHRLVTAEPFEEALVATVGCGGDTDTNAAICGALLGAAYGRDAIPLRWRRQVLACRAVTGDSVVHPRPPEYWGDDAMELAEGLLCTSFRKEETRFEF